MGIQIALLEETLPNITFQLFRSKDRHRLGLSPFRLGGELPNIRLGLAMVTSDAQAVGLYEKLAENYGGARTKEAMRHNSCKQSSIGRASSASAAS